MKKIFIFLILGLFLLSFASALSWTGTTAYYKLDESSGAVIDYSGNGNNGVNEGATPGVTGKINTAYDFESGEADSINISNASSFTGSGFSINAWIKAESIVAGGGIVKAKSVNGYGIYLDSSGYLTFGKIGVNEVKAGSGAIGTGVWHMVSVVYNTTGINYYVNGIFIETDAYSSTFTGGLNYSIGGGVVGESYYFDGIIDEVAIINRSLTASEITELYNGGSGLPYEVYNTITLEYPVNDSTLSDTGANFTVSGNNLSSLTYNWTNITYYVWHSNGTLINSTAVDFSDNNTFNQTQFIDNFILGNYVWNAKACYSNSSFSNCTWASANYTFEVLPFTLIGESYNNVSLSGSTETFTANFSFLGGYRLSKLYFVYNGTSYYSTFTEYDTNIYYAYKSINIPTITTNTNYTFYWNAELENGFIQNSTSHNQTVNNLSIDDCSSYSNLLFNFTMYDEDNQNQLYSYENTSIKISLFFYTLDKAKQVLNYSHFFNRTNVSAICMQNPVNSSSIRVDGVIDYSSAGRFTEFYHISNYTLTNTTIANNISLYNLNESTGQEYRIIYKDSNFVPIEGAIIILQRKYVSEGLFKTTERPKTGTEGYTIGHMVSNDVIYNIMVYKEGQLLATFNEVVADCQNPSITTCTINLNSYESSNIPTDFTNYKDLIFTLTHDYDTRTISSTFTTASGTTSIVSLNVTLYDSLGNTSVCSDSLTASGGSLRCVVPEGFGNSTIVAQLYKDDVKVGYTIISLKQKPNTLYGSSLIFIAILTFLTLAGIGASTDNPMAFGIILALGSIVMVGLNIVYVRSLIGTGATMLWFIMAIILIIIKGAGRQ